MLISVGKRKLDSATTSQSKSKSSKVGGSSKAGKKGARVEIEYEDDGEEPERIRSAHSSKAYDF